MALTKVKSGAVQGIPSTALPAGAILQTVTTSDMTSASYASTNSSSPKTVISNSITPSSTSSKILIFGFASIGNLYSNYSGTLHWLGLKLKRGSTVIGETSDLSSLTTLHGADASGAEPMHAVIPPASSYPASRPTSIPFHFADSPNTTSATTYNIQGVIERYNHGPYTMLRNGGGYNYNNAELASATCQLTLMEIKG